MALIFNRETLHIPFTTPVLIAWNVMCAKPTANVLFLELPTSSYLYGSQVATTNPCIVTFCSKGLDIFSKAIKLVCVIVWKSTHSPGT